MNVTIETQGEEQEPVVVFDAFTADPHGLVEDAAMLAFAPMGEHYPGIRALLPEPVTAGLVAQVAPVAREVFGGEGLTTVEAYYSLVTQPPAALTPIQRLPHFDQVSPTRLALLLYLAEDERSGTAFLRHRTTGFERVDAARLPVYRDALEEDVRRHGLPPPSYIAGDTPIFAEVARHRGLFNRAILYRSNTLHCAAIPADMVFSRDPYEGRLTVNLFLDCA